MPIFRSQAKLIYYAHVPKCAGSAVDDYLKKRFGGLAFHDNRFLATAEPRRWTRSSPQHIDRTALGQLFPDDFFDHAFAVVRHPVDRLVSAFHFQVEREGTVPADTSFGDWLEDFEEQRETRPFIFDNHVRPMDEIVPEGARVFRLEEGLGGIVDWLDEVTGVSDGPREIGVKNRRTPRRQGLLVGTKTETAMPDMRAMRIIHRLYATDFSRFGYLPEGGLEALPQPAARGRRLWPFS